ncbi:hypothetical protein BDV12DRAFT_189303 [Aspergillus spectabilis]
MEYAPVELPKPPVPYTCRWRFTAKSRLYHHSERQNRKKAIDATRLMFLEVVDLLKAGDGHNSQVFAGIQLVAKIYDPLYFDDDKGELPGQWTPKVYESYSLIRMILIEHIPGISMADACTIVDIESRIYERNIWPSGLEPRNVIIQSPAGDQPRVAFLDFCHALFNRRRDDLLSLQLNFFLGEYISPPNQRPSITAEFAHTVAIFTPGMRERWSNEWLK